MLKRYFIILILAVSTLLSLYEFYKRGVAHLYYSNSNKAYKLTVNEREGDLILLKKAEENIIKAINLIPKDPHYLHLKANILNSIDFKNSNLHEVKSLLQQSVKLRSSWWGTWIDLAYVNIQIEGFSPESKFYLNKAQQLGGLQIGFVNSYLMILIENWNNLDSKDTYNFYSYLKIASRNNATFSNIMKYAYSKDKHELICIQIRYDSNYKTFKDSSLYSNYCN
ncbi:hypothetical protein [Pseudoalteromonas piratica]|uniref:Uncharacterized protein n=1 Tax=Pseudoalteromonas piratica TaxID=1348114 RepID=A0A0A7EHG8_9GAMM|nr:hypothetical protein [Pseudoalteromonas piratica]AIY65442.1 hypothetical protein OM33_09990 [Pseudoalteromonas piratica]